jgi:hypothetical protein
MIETSDPGRRRETRLRVRVKRYRLSMHKSRDRTLHARNAGGYQLVDIDSGTVVAGDALTLSFGDVETILAERAARQNRAPKGRAA